MVAGSIVPAAAALLRLEYRGFEQAETDVLK
jgi:hypothetical protein